MIAEVAIASGAAVIIASLRFARWVLSRPIAAVDASTSKPQDYRAPAVVAPAEPFVPLPDPPMRPFIPTGPNTYEAVLRGLSAKRKKYKERWLNTQGPASVQAYKELGEIDTKIARIEDERDALAEGRES